MNEIYRLPSGELIRVLKEGDMDRCVAISVSRKATLPYLFPWSEIDKLDCITDDRLFHFHNADEYDEQQLDVRDKRYEQIRAIIESDAWAKKEERHCLVQKAIETEGISRQTLITHLWQYWAMGGKNALIPKKRNLQAVELTIDQKNIRWALNTFYYTPSKNTLMYAYHQMLIAKYTDKCGTLVEAHPTIWQFRYYYRQNNNTINENISRYGTSYYQRNVRPVTGSVREKYDNIGVYMTDSTVADIYLVDRLTRRPMERPNIYIMVDAYSNLITALHVGYEAGADAMRLLFVNACADKVEYCKSHGVIIEDWQWPSHHLPDTLITDRGTEFMGEVVDSMCATYGIEIEHLPAYRPELKGPVEKAFDTLQGLYKPMLAEKGVIRPDYQERGAPDYRAMAAIDIEEFTRIVLRSVVYCNASHVLDKFERTPEMIEGDMATVPASIWRWCIERRTALKEPNRDSFTMALLPRTEGKITRRGLVVNKIRYAHPDFKERFVRAGLKSAETVTVAYLPDNVNTVWLLENGVYTKFELASKSYANMTSAEVFDYLKGEGAANKDLKENDLKKRLELMKAVSDIAESAAPRAEKPKRKAGVIHKAVDKSLVDGAKTDFTEELENRMRCIKDEM